MLPLSRRLGRRVVAGQAAPCQARAQPAAQAAPALALFPDDVVGWIQTTQPEAWAIVEPRFGRAPTALVFARALDQETLDALARSAPDGVTVVGIGGGSMTVPLLVWRGVQPVRAVGTSSACGVAIGMASAAGYALHAPAGALPAHAVGYIYLPAAIGVAIASVLAAPYGTRLAHRIGGKALKQVFAAFMVMMGIAILASG